MNPKYVVARHHALIGVKLRQVMRGEIKRLMIFAPPRHGKSELATQIFPSFYFGHFPQKSVIVCAYNQDKADDFGRETLKYMQSNEYLSLFPPECQVSPNSESIKRFQTNGGGNYYAVGVGSGITGRGGHIIIIDDPYKSRKEADSEGYNDDLWTYYKSTLFTRLMTDEQGNEGSIVLIQTRWNSKDLAWNLIQQQQEEQNLPKWEVLNLVALIEDEEQQTSDPLGRKANEALWPERYPAPLLLQIKSSIGTREWQSQYAQDPIDAEGAIFHREWFKFFCFIGCDGNHKDECVFFPDEKFQEYQSWDMSYKKTATSDYVVGYSGVTYRGRLFVTDRSKFRGNLPTTVDKFREFCQTHPILATKYVEAKANGQAVIDTLSGEIPGIVPVHPERVGDKESRWQAAAPAVQSGNVLFPRNASWTNDALDWICSVPGAKYDDDADAISQLIIMTLGRATKGFGAFEWYRQKAEQVSNVLRGKQNAS
jgi:predicted phage terminase large subunit-like protein